MSISRPEKEEYGDFYAQYIAKVPQGDLVRILEDQSQRLGDTLYQLPDRIWDSAYEEGKWTLKEVVGHLGDTERVMGYRLLRISRADQTEIPGFDQDYYVEHSTFSRRSPQGLIEEFQAIRKSNIELIRPLTEEDGLISGIANGVIFSTRAVAYILAGHVFHHAEVLRDKYQLDIQL